MVSYKLGKLVGDFEKLMHVRGSYDPPSSYLKKANKGFMFIPKNAPGLLSVSKYTSHVKGTVYYPGCGWDLSCLWVFDNAGEFIFQDYDERDGDCIRTFLGDLNEEGIIQGLVFEESRDLFEAEFVLGKKKKKLKGFIGDRYKISTGNVLNGELEKVQAVYLRGTWMLLPQIVLELVPRIASKNMPFLISGTYDPNESLNEMINDPNMSRLVPPEITLDYIVNHGFRNVTGTWDYVLK